MACSKLTPRTASPSLTWTRVIAEKNCWFSRKKRTNQLNFAKRIRQLLTKTLGNRTLSANSFSTLTSGLGSRLGCLTTFNSFATAPLDDDEASVSCRSWIYCLYRFSLTSNTSSGRTNLPSLPSRNPISMSNCFMPVTTSSSSLIFLFSNRMLRYLGSVGAPMMLSRSFNRIAIPESAGKVVDSGIPGFCIQKSWAYLDYRDVFLQFLVCGQHWC
jgi:hypothetical protein